LEFDGQGLLLVQERVLAFIGFDAVSTAAQS
jgi:hypothetical protein